MIATGPGLLAKLYFVGVPPEVSIKSQRDEVFVDILGIDLSSGVPPGTVGGASPSRATDRTSIGRSENDDGLVLGNPTLTGFSHISDPIDFTPGPFIGVGFDNGQ